MRKMLSGPRTGYSHPRCYARHDQDCSTKISREHFISEALLRRIELNNTAKIAGLAWQDREKFNVVPIKGLASNILCKRHNEALSSLDSMIAQFANTVNRFDRLEPTRNETAEFGGFEIERWMLKCLLGLTTSGNIKSALKRECVDLLFKKSDWPEHWGLYFCDTASSPIYHTDSLSIEPRTGPDRKLILACNFHIQGLPLVLVMGKPGNPRRLGVWRPKEIRFKLEASEKILCLSWEGSRCGEPVTLNRIGSYRGHPPHWKGWAKDG
jgi:hypothetical protein